MPISNLLANKPFAFVSGSVLVYRMLSAGYTDVSQIAYDKQMGLMSF